MPETWFVFQYKKPDKVSVSIDVKRWDYEKERESRGWDWSLRGILATVQSGLRGQEISYFMDTIANHQERPGSPG